MGIWGRIINYLICKVQFSGSLVDQFSCFCFGGFYIKMGFEVSDELLGTFVPVLIYWAYSGIYVLLDSFENYRLHTRKDEDEKNLVSKRTVVKGVLLQQTIQAIVAIILFTV